MRALTNNAQLDIFIVCTTYNHENYIKRAVLSIINQQTKYSYKLILCDDQSTDKTSKICSELTIQYPNKILYFRHNQNIGLINNYLFAFKKALGSRYIAYCDGDDYWSDPEKLEIQASFMDRNPQYSLTYHDDILLHDRDIDYEVYSKRIEHPSLFQVYDKHFISAPSLMARNYLLPEHFEIMKYAGSGDIALFALATVYGEIGYINRKMAVYTLSEGAQTSMYFKNVEREFSNLIYILRLNKIYKKGFDKLLLEKTITILNKNAEEISMLSYFQIMRIKVKNSLMLFSFIPTNVANRIIIILRYFFNAAYRKRILDRKQ